jgi:uncharacterized glyoxalase superfamily protein PhnB
MPDSFDALRDVLRAANEPIAPDLTFATELRARLERALGLPRGVAVSDTTFTQTTQGPVLGSAVPYLAVRGAAQALDWYARVLGARLRGEPNVMPDGRIGHAELDLAGGAIYLADEHPDIGVVAPTVGAAAVSLVLQVADADETASVAVAEGARLDRDPYDAYGSRNVWIVDPFGHRWLLSSALNAAAPVVDPPTSTPLEYLVLDVVDSAKARAFYGAVLGWRFTPGRVEDGWNVEGPEPLVGMAGGKARSDAAPMWRVPDVRAAVERIRAAGGTSSEPEQMPYGLSAECSDDQGSTFWLLEGR